MASMKKANVRRRKTRDEEKQGMSDVSYFSRLLYDRQDERNMRNQNNLSIKILQSVTYIISK